MEIAQYYTKSFYEDMDRLGVKRPNIAPTATGHIPDQIELISKLLEKGHAYEVNGNVYFSVASFPGYGKLSGRTTGEARQPGGRVESRSEKRDPADFALWKKAEPGHLMKWNSPWSEGYPGWHAECSAMAMKYLGETIDIHGGGMENKFPHHECEIAQSEAATGRPYVRYWMHNNMVTVNGTKMGKSLGNFINLKDIFEQFSPSVIRFFILQSHYRSPLDFSEQAIDASKSGLEKLRDTWLRLQNAAAGNGLIDTAPFDERLTEAMNDDFNTPVAISILFDLARLINTALDSSQGISEQSRKECMKVFSAYGDQVLGIISGQELKESPETGSETQALKGAMELLIELRNKARTDRDYQLSDLIRDRLAESGIALKDTREGTEWKVS